MGMTSGILTFASLFTIFIQQATLSTPTPKTPQSKMTMFRLTIRLATRANLARPSVASRTSFPSIYTTENTIYFHTDRKLI